MNIFLFHGAFGDETENWFPWLKESSSIKYKYTRIENS